MDNKPTRDDYDQLIAQLGPTEPESGPDILAVNHKREEAQTAPRQAAEVEPVRRTAPRQTAPRAAEPQRRRTAQSGTAQPSATRRARQTQQRPAAAQRTARAAAPEAAPQCTATRRRTTKKEGGSGFAGSAWLRAIVICLVLVGCAVALALFVMDSAADLFGLNQEDKQVEVTVEEGMKSGEIIDLLAETGVVEQKLTFRLYAGIKGALDEFKPGEYVMNRNFSYDEIIIMLRTGIRNEEERATVTVTFYEGMSAWDIADRLEENKVCSAEDFIEAVNTGDYSDYSFMSMIPEEELRFVRLEGFLFPDTYQFYVGENPENAVRRFLDNFETKVTDDIIQQLNNQNLTLYEGINLASIIQGESSKVDEMGKVSSVFHNRLDDPGTYPMLQSDVSRSYINNDIIPHVDIINDEQVAAYDSYQCSGLPVAPVNNPGLDAILAAAHPEDTPYYFFVSDAEGTFYYATTFNEHVNNVYRAGLLGDITGIATEDN